MNTSKMSKEDIFKIEILRTKNDIEAGMGKEDEEDQILRGFQIKVQHANMFDVCLSLLP